MSNTAALKALFELLEEYAPVWYTEEHHKLAVEALAQSADYRATATPLKGPEGTALTEFSAPQSGPQVTPRKVKEHR
jgi:hypothetical protein